MYAQKKIRLICHHLPCRNQKLFLMKRNSILKTKNTWKAKKLQRKIIHCGYPNRKTVPDRLLTPFFLVFWLLSAGQQAPYGLATTF